MESPRADQATVRERRVRSKGSPVREETAKASARSAAAVRRPPAPVGRAGPEKVKADRGGRVDERKGEGVDRKRKRRGIRMESALAFGGSRLAPDAPPQPPQPDARPPSAEPETALPRSAGPQTPAVVVAEARRSPAGPETAPEPAGHEPKRAAAPKRPSTGPVKAEQSAAKGSGPEHPPAAPRRSAEPPAATTIKRTVKSALKPKRAARAKPAAQPEPARERRHRAEAPPPAEAAAPAQAPIAAPPESGPSVLGEWVRRQRRLLSAAAVGFLGGVVVYAMLGPEEPPAPPSPPRSVERAAGPSTAVSPEAPWLAPGGRPGADTAYRPPAGSGYPAAPAYPGGQSYPPSPAYSGGSPYPYTPASPSGPAYPSEAYRPWGRTDGRDERPREAPPGTLGGYPSAPSPYVPFSPGR
jgi:hypothetical protein